MEAKQSQTLYFTSRIESLKVLVMSVISHFFVPIVGDENKMGLWLISVTDTTVGKVGY